MKFLHGLEPQHDLTYSEVFLVPRASSINSRFDVDLSSDDGTGNHIPLVVANMNAVAGRRMAETTARRGAITVLPQDIRPDILAHTISQIKAASPIYETPITLTPEHTVRDAMSLIHKRAHNAVIVIDSKQHPIGIFTEEDAAGQDMFTPLSAAATTTEIFKLQAGLSPKKMYETLQAKHLRVAPVVRHDKLIGIVTAKGALRAEIYQPNLDRHKKLRVAVAIGINGDVKAKTVKALEMGADVIVLDTAHGHQAKMMSALKTARSVAGKVPLVAGNVVTAEATRDLIEAGADIVKVGVGPGAMCTTRMMTGVGRPQFSAVLDCAAEAKLHGKHVWADGGVRHPRDVVLALAAGASNVMLGSWLAGTYESTADIQRDNDGRLFKENFGMASRRAVQSRNSQATVYELAKKELFEEGISSSRMYLNPAMPGTEDVIDQISAGLRSAMTYEGSSNLAEFQERAIVGLQSSAGFSEGQPLSTSW